MKMFSNNPPSFKMYDVLIYALKSYFCNEVVNNIPFHSVRLFFYSKFLGVKIGKHSSIGMHTHIIHPREVSIGNNCAIGQFVHLDGRGSLSIGNNVNIAGKSAIYSGTHNHKSPKWEYIKLPVTIEDDVWIASNSVLIPGVHVGRGAIVAAGAVVVKNVGPFEIVGGNPAKKIGDRVKKIEYLTNYFPYFY